MNPFYRSEPKEDDQHLSCSRWVKLFTTTLICFTFFVAQSQTSELDKCNITWLTQSHNSSESMPCGGGDIGLNVWVEKGDLYFYIARSGTFDGNNALLKAGRVKLTLSPNPFEGTGFKQELVLQNGNVKISGRNKGVAAEILLWVDVFSPVIHLDIKSTRPLSAEASYESWRYRNRVNEGSANNANSYKWRNQGKVVTEMDTISFRDNSVFFYHHNKPETIFDVTVKQQGMDQVKGQLFNPVKNLCFGGMMEGTDMKPSGEYQGIYQDTDFKGWKLKTTRVLNKISVNIYLYTKQVNQISNWEKGLNAIKDQSHSRESTAYNETANWWKQLWDKSFVYLSPEKADDSAKSWQAGRNYQLFRYMLACNAFGEYPTKFNGGLFTFDPTFVLKGITYTPDFRNWGGGTFTAQNQRLVYYPMIRNGDFEMMKPQFNFYLRNLKNAELRSKVYWGHNGACFTEQLENFGLPNSAEYGWERPQTFDKGVEYNAWLEYEWDTVLEFCLMMLEEESYTGKNIIEYLPFIESCLTFFNEHYQYLANQRGIKTFDADGKLVLYPGSAGETYKMAYNATSTISALKTILTRLLELPSNYLKEKERVDWQTMLSRIPPITFASFNGITTIAPAKSWERKNNSESMQLYPVFPWGIYGIGKPDLQVALNTWKYDTNVVKFRSYVGWKQDNIFAARLGLTSEASGLTVNKLQNGPYRFPAFWGPGFDWTPDHNWGGSGMIGLQEMLLQTEGDKIYLFPAWPKDWDVHFKLHAPHNTTVEVVLKKGKVEQLDVIPSLRKNDIIWPPNYTK